MAAGHSSVLISITRVPLTGQRRSYRVSVSLWDVSEGSSLSRGQVVHSVVIATVEGEKKGDSKKKSTSAARITAVTCFLSHKPSHPPDLSYTTFSFCPRVRPVLLRQTPGITSRPGETSTTISTTA